MLHAVGFVKSLLGQDLKQTHIDGQSDLDGQASQLEYIFQLSGRKRPCVELVQSHNLSLPNSSSGPAGGETCSTRRSKNDRLTGGRVSTSQQACPANAIAIDVVVGVSTQASVS
eukprot:743867-Pyramimonas_sp.AAC.1